MAQTIQIRRGTGSAVPSSLADGELAINLDSGRLYYGSGSAVLNNFTFKDLTAENYTVSSSVTHYTFQALSGSTDFGDDSADIHKRTGSLNVSGALDVVGNISSNGTITANVFNVGGVERIRTDGDFIDLPDSGLIVTKGIRAESHITASGNISSSGNIYSNNFLADNGNHIIGRHVNDGLQIRTQNSDPIVFRTNGLNNRLVINDDGSNFSGHITASGNISASGNITAIGNLIASGNLICNGATISNTIIATDIHPQTNTTATLEIGTDDNSHPLTDHTITIGFSNPSKAAPLTINSNITASGNISSSGIIIAEHITSTDDMTVGDGLTVSRIKTSLNAVTSFQITDNNDQPFIHFSSGIEDQDSVLLLGDKEATGNETQFKIDDGNELITSNVNFEITKTTDATDATGDTGALRVEGGASIAKKVFIGTNLSSGPITASGNISSSGVIHGQHIRMQNHLAISKTSDNIAFGFENNTPINIGKSGNPTKIFGHLTASGNISASGKIHSSGYFKNGVGLFVNPSFTGNVTASGDISSSGTVTANTLRLTSVTDASATSTGHAFQTGPTNGVNIIINSNEMMARNNGSTANLHLNADGGSVFFHNNVANSNTIIGVGGHITASGNISSSGNVTANSFVETSRTRIKILPRDFVADDVGRPLMIENDNLTSGDEAFLTSFGGNPLYAFVEIPTGYTATHAKISGSDTGQAYKVYEGNIGSKDMTSKSAGTAINTEANITDVAATDTNYLFIEVTTDGVDDEIFGGYVTITPS